MTKNIEQKLDKYKYSVHTIDSSTSYPLPIKNAVNDMIGDYKEEGWELIDQQFASSKHTNGTLPDYVKETYTLKFRKEKKRMVKNIPIHQIVPKEKVKSPLHQSH